MTLIDDFYQKINYKIEGEGIPIVLLHGFMESLEVWNLILPYFRNKKKYKIILIDLPGHGKSFFPNRMDIITSMEKTSVIVLKILEKEYINKAIFIGHSMGGYISLSIAEKNPNLFLGLCLLHSTAYSDSYQKKKIRIKSIKLVKNNFPLFVDNNINKLFDPRKLNILQKQIFFVKRIALSTSIYSVISFLKGMSIRKNKIHIIKNTSFPKLYIIGLHDLILPPKKMKKEVKYINSITTKYFDLNVGHMAHVEDPNGLIKILSNFDRIIS
ncbi:alpha/beta fold hydrolase [Blattabacterium cuenoti]|uniref:alpha/beta fold hydrolase n=1 Tax=Blattabacterium cuenoti TaxID=1653831 RepID=UPI00163BCF4D|nr:alpha/beta hydrolase [Blattabacterium cuenoti]